MDPFKSRRPGWCAACALALGFAFGTAQAGDMRPGAHLWKNSNGVWCWNSEFVAAAPPPDCGDPKLIAQSAAPAPFVAPPAPAVPPLAVAPIAAPSPVQTQSVAPVAAPGAEMRAPKMDRH